MTERTSLIIEGTTEVQIYYEDTDFTGFVYHGNYLKYFDRARQLLAGVNLLKQLHSDLGLHFVVAHIDVRYLAPAKYGDTLRIRSHTELTRSPIHIYTHDAFISDRHIASARVQLVCLGPDDKPRRINHAALNLFAEHLARKKENSLAKP